MTELNFEAYKDQRDFLSTDTRWKAVIGGLQSGKTHVGAIELLIRSLEDKRRGCNFLVSGKSYRSMTRTVIPKIKEVFPDDYIVDFNRSKYTMELKSGVTIHFISLDDKRTIDDIRGSRFNVVWLDEAAYLPEYAFKVVTGRLNQGKDQRGFITSSPNGRNWVYDYFGGDGYDDSYSSVVGVSTDDNPYISDDYVEDMKKNYDGEYLEQEVYGKFVKFEGLVYSEFSRDENIISVEDVEDYEFRDFFYGYDSGYNNPRVFLKIGETVNGNYVILDEWYREEWLISDASDKMSGVIDDGVFVYCDPSAKSDIEEMKDDGIRAVSGDNEVSAGIQKVKSLFAKNELHVVDVCQETIGELTSYRWKDDDSKDKPRKENDHACDGLRYGIFTRDKRDDGIAVGTVESDLFNGGNSKSRRSEKVRKSGY